MEETGNDPVLSYSIKVNALHISLTSHCISSQFRTFLLSLFLDPLARGNVKELIEATTKKREETMIKLI